MSSHQDLLQTLRGGLIVSCQPVDDGPLDTVSAVVAFALAARDGGARAVRIEGAENVAAVAQACDLPIIGIIKRDLLNSSVRITPFLEDVRALASAGAQVIAVDGTDRARPVPVTDLLNAVHAAGCIAMADLSTEAEARCAHELGFEILGTTMSGYTGGRVPDAPDLELVAACRRIGNFVVAEGRYNSPATAAAAISAGADAVCVGSAITRTEHVTGWFRSAVDQAARSSASTVLAFDIGGTKTLAALVRNGQILDRQVIPTQEGVGSDAWFGQLGKMAEDWGGRYQAVGAAVTGFVQDGHWYSLNPKTLAIPDRTPLVPRLREVFGVPATALNDAQAAAWGEYCRGAGLGKDMVFITVSSGIGGGIVLGGKLIQGARGLAGSLGQIMGMPGAGRLESRASGFGIAAAAAGMGQASDTRSIFSAHQRGESWATKLIDGAADDLTSALLDLQIVLDPELIVLGGGIGLLQVFRDRVLEGVKYVAHGKPTIKPAALGSDPGIIGIADFALK